VGVKGRAAWSPWWARPSYVETCVTFLRSAATSGQPMHHELSVRENVFLYGAIICFRRAQLEQRFDEIIAFAELKDFVEARVKELSTGMRQRLTFAISSCRHAPSGCVPSSRHA